MSDPYKVFDRTLLKIEREFYQGYGGPDEWWVRVVYQNRQLERRQTGSDQSLHAHQLREKWICKLGHKSELDAFLNGCPLDTPLCDHCGGTHASSMVNVKRFCQKPECQAALAAYQEELRTASERHQRELREQMEQQRVEMEQRARDRHERRALHKLLIERARARCDTGGRNISYPSGVASRQMRELVTELTDALEYWL